MTRQISVHLRLLHSDEDKLIFFTSPITSVLLVLEKLFHLFLQLYRPEQMRLFSSSAVHPDKRLNQECIVVRLSGLRWAVLSAELNAKSTRLRLTGPLPSRQLRTNIPVD